MVDDTKNCDEVGAYLERICPELQGAVLVIHTKNNGEISEASSGKNNEELEPPARRVQPHRYLDLAAQGDRLGADAQGRLGRAQRHHHRRPARLRRQEQHPAGANARARLAADVFRQRRAGNRLGHGHARLHGVRRIHPERGRHLRARRHGWRGGTRTKGFARRRGRYRRRRQGHRRAGHRPAPAARSFQSRVQGPGRARSRVVRQCGTAGEGVHPRGDAGDRVQDDAGGGDRSHRAARRQWPGRLPLRRRLLRPAVAEGHAFGRRLRPAVSEGARLHPRSSVCPCRSTCKTR